LAEVLGVAERSESASAGGGASEVGGPSRQWFEDDFRNLGIRAEGLDRSLSELEGLFQQRRLELAATPDRAPVQGRLSHGFGWRKDPFSGEREFHKGLDIVTATGTQVQAPADGVVTRAGRFGDLGKTLDIAHGYGFVTRYAHLSQILVSPGRSVRRGEAIGLVGSTGRSTGPHLHYEVFRDGRQVNPAKYLRD
jgi:murein DD-endopeptidase MepM/ murein hydrolase activator NlpD